MSMPAGVGYGRIVGRLIRAVMDGPDADSTPDGVPIEGATVTIRAAISHARVPGATPPVTVVFDEIVCRTDTDGILVGLNQEPGVWVVATDDPDTEPQIGFYTVSVRAASMPPLSWRITVPEGETVDLTTAVPVPDSPAAAVAEWVAVREQVVMARDEAVAARDEAVAAAAGGGGTGAVTSVNGQTGAVSLGAADVGADPAGTAAGLVGALAIPDSADDVGAIPEPAVEGAPGDVLVTDGAGGRTWATPDAGGVTSVDGQTGAVSLSSTYVAQANLTVTPGASVSGSNTGDQTLPTWTTLAGKPAVVAAGATQADARTAIGAGTSNLTIGTTSTTAKAGNYTPPDASTTVKGIVELATTAEATTGTDTTRAVTPAGVAAAIAGVGGGVTDHGALSGLADDDHTLYALADGTRGAFAATSHTHTASQISDAIIATGSSVSGSNTGDQDLSGYALSTQTINAQTGTTYTLVASDASKLVTCANSGAITVTVPASTFAAGQRVDLLVLGAGMVTVAAGSGMTLNGTPSLVSRAQYSAFTVLFLSATSAVVVGDLATP